MILELIPKISTTLIGSIFLIYILPPELGSLEEFDE